jgi:negative regulator of flagellin synthesis FlgM
MPDPIRGVTTPNPVTTTSTTQTSSTKSADAAISSSSTLPASPSADLADVGQTEALLQTIIQAASNTPGIDQAKVSDLQKAIASGTYQTNPQAIAQKLVELENQLGTAGQLQ